MLKKIMFAVSLAFAIAAQAKMYVQNEVRAVILGPSKTVLVLTSDIRPTLDGRQRTLRDVVIEENMIIDAEKLHMTVTDEDVDRYLRQLQKNYSKKQIEDSLQAMGFTMAEAREQFKRQELITRIFDYRVRSKVSVNRADVEADWVKNAPFDEASISLSEATVKSTLSPEDFAKTVQKSKDAYSWAAPVALKESELASSKRSLFAKQCGDIVSIVPVVGGYEVTKLVAKTDARVLPLITGNKAEDDKRIAEVEEKLRVEKFNAVRAEYEHSLLKNGRINFTYESDRRAVFGE